MFIPGSDFILQKIVNAIILFFVVVVYMFCAVIKDGLDALGKCLFNDGEQADIELLLF